jgi:quinol monooxygenase YgiN
VVTVGLLVRLEAKTGRELDLELFLKEALALAEEEPATTVWFALRLSPSTFAIFDGFADEAGREAHLSGRIAAAVNERASELLAHPPTIERVDVLAAKLSVPART